MNTTWIALGDIHNNSANLHMIPELDAAEGIIITGDITFAQGVEQAAKTLAPFIETGKKLLVQPGNMDTPDVANWLALNNWNIHREIKTLPGNIPCLGLGFSPTTPFHTPGEYPDETFAQWLDEIMSSEPQLPRSSTWVFVSHTPPYGTKCDKLADGTSVGSMAVRRFIEQYQPTYCLCGHIHEAFGTDVIGDTTIINPGTLADGGYILLNISSATSNLSATLKKL